MRIFAIGLVLSGILLGQDAVDYNMVTRIRQEAFHHSQVMEILGELTDGIGPRLTNSPAAREANKWSEAKFKEWGLDARLESWGPFGRGWTLKHSEMEMTEPRILPLLALPKAWSDGTQGPIEGEAMMIKIEDESDFEKYAGKLSGKILFLSENKPLEVSEKPDFKRYDEEELDEMCGYDMPSERSGRGGIMRWFKRSQFADQRAAFLAQEGVLATVEVSSFKHGVIRVMGTSGYEKEKGGGPVQMVMALEHYNAIARYLENKEKVTLKLDVQVAFDEEDPMGYNTIGEIPGTGKNKKEIVMAGAHMDSWHAGTGTLDNGTGVAVVMEAARILKTLGIQPNRTIRFGLWTGEEQGLLGSKGYVKEHFVDLKAPDHPAMAMVPERWRDYLSSPTPKKEHEQFSVYFNMDNGGGRFRGIYCQENAAAVPIFKSWLAPFEDLGADRVTMNNTGSTDHISFDSAGLPGFQFIQDPLSYFTRNHHSNLDTLDHAQADDLKQAAAIMATFLYQASQRPGLFPRKPMPEKEDQTEMLDKLMPKKSEAAATTAPTPNP
ncbi:MAG: M20/M25/M40 family metallo-hydrolase [Acidobacteria bacterium]|nr:M20/M25/M40 family metallo-hydrolase [Acidobacteriota bacterium]